MNKIDNFLKNKVLIISYLALFILSINLTTAEAQILDGGQNPPGLNWRQINTENFQILYPSSLQLEAQRVANSLHYFIDKISKTLNKKPRRISVILQNQTVESNGFVQLAPRRSEFFVTPSQEFDYQDWINSLAIHELRHVVQFDKITGNLRAPFFEELGLAIFGITLPAWFFEGDAVITETILTPAGRGRQPSWEMPFRANLLNGREFSYSKNYLGSIKDRTPGYYQLGYFMVSKLRREHGGMILDTLYKDMAKHPLRPWNLSRASKKYTGLNTTEWHTQTLAELKETWRKQLELTPTVLYPGINFRKDTVPEDYLLPQRINDQKILAIKQSKIHTPALVTIDQDGKEEKLLFIGIQQEPNLSYAAGKAVWDEFRVDMRYDKRSFNVICIYDLNTRKYRQLTHRTRLFSPALSADGKKIAAVEVDFANHMSIVELDAQSGMELSRYQNPDQGILQTPQYHSSGNKIVYLKVSQQGKAIEEIDIQTKEVNLKLNYQQQLISRPIYAGDDILFKAHYNGIDNIYGLKGTEISQITQASIGAFYPSYDHETNTLLFSNYQLNGYDIAKLEQNDWASIPLSSIKNQFIDYSKPLIQQEGESINFSDVPKLELNSRPYRDFTHFFNFHSVEPDISTNEFTDDWNLGFKTLSNNLLNTFDFYAGYAYNVSLRRSEYKAGFSYKAIYPIFNINYTNRARLAAINDNSKAVVFNWREQETEFNVFLPFKFNYLSQGGSAGLEFSTSYTSRYDILASLPNYTINQNIAFPMRYGFYYGQNSRRSARDLAPRWGHNYRLTYRHFPFENQIEGSYLSLKTLFYAPGLFRNHSISASFNFQNTSGVYQFTNDIPTISGYNRLDNTEALKNTLLLDYKFPFAYPDWEISSLAYIKRLRAGLFADFENISSGKINLPRTYGLELSADLNLLRFYLPNFQAGGKMIFTTQKTNRKPIFEIGLTYSY